MQRILLEGKLGAVYRYTRWNRHPCLAAQHFTEDGVTDLAAMDAVYAELERGGLIEQQGTEHVPFFNPRTGQCYGVRSLWVVVA